MPGDKGGSGRLGLQGSWEAGFQGACTPREMQFAHLRSTGAGALQPTVPTCVGPASQVNLWTPACTWQLGQVLQFGPAVAEVWLSPLKQSPCGPRAAPAPAPPSCQHCICPWLASLGQKDSPALGALPPHMLCRGLSQPQGQPALTAALCPVSARDLHTLLLPNSGAHRTYAGGVTVGCPAVGRAGRGFCSLQSLCSVPFNQACWSRCRHPRGGLCRSALRHISHIQGQHKSMVLTIMH